jgi:hypothetical protein
MDEKLMAVLVGDGLHVESKRGWVIALELDVGGLALARDPAGVWTNHYKDGWGDIHEEQIGSDADLLEWWEN